MTVARNERVHLSDEDRRHLRELRTQRPAHHAPKFTRSRGAQIADRLAAIAGSWRFIIFQSILIVLWMGLNVTGYIYKWDPYPFILLNLLLSFQAAYAGAVILMSQNRQAEIDRKNAEYDYRINVKAELEIELLHNKIDTLREQEILKLITIVERLSAHLVQERDAVDLPDGGEKPA